ncbi:MAG: fumarylacetoacetate hydrolase family protein [Rhodospirillales bacterium]|nr:fumarylacetoacetate hydrolase family protein [Rhodospirillales bacterium]
MRWARIDLEGAPTFGIVEGNEIETVTGTPFGEYAGTGRRLDLGSVTFLPPVFPPTFYCVGLNYLDHILEQAKKKGVEPNVPQQPDVGYRAQSALIGHGADVIIPADAPERVHYEGELVVVIGKQAKNVSEADALDIVFGYTIGNDVSQRDWQYGDRTMWRGKNCDTFKPMGPWIETDVDLDSLETSVRVNGKPVITFPTNNMLFGVEKYISTISKYVTFQPGDVLWMGTEGSSPNLVDGDVVEIDINQIGVLRNRFVKEKQ